MITRIIRKTPLANAVKTVCAFTVKSKCNMSVDEAEKIVNSVYADDGKTSVRDVPRSNETDENIDLDIIIPAYNVENYIAQCVESALNQKTKYKFRVIAVNDGSKDNTGKIIDRYSDYPNTVIIHTENLGVSNARNTGLDNAKSKYVMFIDSDDFLAENAVERMMDVAYENDAQIVEGSYQFTDLNGNITKKYYQKSGKIDAMNDLKGFPWAKVYKRELFNCVQFPLNYWYQDSILRQIVFPQIDRAYGISDIVYCRRLNPSGITIGGKGKPRSIQSLWVTKRLFEDRKHFGLEINQKYYEYIIKMSLLTYHRMVYLPDEVKKAVFVLFADFFNNNFKNFNSNTNREIEKALKTGNYSLYKICCEMTSV